MNTYEAVYIITPQNQDTSIPEVLEQIENELKSHSCRIESVQKLDKRQFERPTSKINSGYYVRIRFSANPDAISIIKNRIKFNPAVYRQFYIKHSSNRTVK